MLTRRSRKPFFQFFNFNDCALFVVVGGREGTLEAGFLLRFCFGFCFGVCLGLKTIISILPRPIWPPYAGQSRLCYFRCLELKQRGYKTILVEFYFFRMTRNEEDLEKISKAFDEVYSIKINALDFFLIFCKLVFNQILSFFFAKGDKTLICLHEVRVFRF